jgi:glycosyltransferase involved in cell wall biosynthesis
VRAQVPQARLLVVGDGPLQDELVRMSQALGLGDAVVFTGLQRDIPGYLSVMDAFVLSSTRESFPLAAREAMAAGLPVIAPRIGGCPEVVEHGRTGYLFQAGRDDELAARMLDLLQGDRRATFGRAARARVERLFSRQAWIDGDERVYCAWLPAPSPAPAAASPPASAPAQAAVAAPSAPLPLH